MRFGRRALLVLLPLMAVACTAGAPSSSTPPAATTSAPTSVPSVKAPATANGGIYDEQADARADIAAALALAKSDGKRVLLDFGADWCLDCHVLAAYLDSAAGQKLVDASFHVVSIDVGYWDHNVDIAAEYGDPISAGIPGVVALETDGTIVGSSANGALASARGMSEQEVLDYLARWAP